MSDQGKRLEAQAGVQLTAACLLERSSPDLAAIARRSYEQRMIAVRERRAREAAARWHSCNCMCDVCDDRNAQADAENEMRKDR